MVTIWTSIHLGVMQQNGFLQRQKNDPIIISLGRDEQRALARHKRK